MIRVGRTLARYYLSLRMSAALAVPDLGIPEIPNPAPIVRQFPARIRDGWDEREVIRTGDTDWIVVQEDRRSARSPFNWN